MSRVPPYAGRFCITLAALALGACASRSVVTRTDVASVRRGDVIVSRAMTHDAPLTADPAAAHWADADVVTIDANFLGEPIEGRPTEVRSRYTSTHLYLLYTCPYDTLNLKPDPVATSETPKLWTWDVAEAFIGWDAGAIERYKEFQVSPQGEWVDLDIDRLAPTTQQGMAWNSGFEVKARVDERARVWYGEMKIPFDAIDPRGPAPGRILRVGLYRIAGAEPRTYYAWQPTGAPSFHVPQAFGLLRMQ